MNSLERQRRKLDKLVTPGGEPRPEKKSRPPRAPGIRRVASVAEDTFEIEREENEPDWADRPYHRTEFFGQFNFRDTILDQLDRYWVYLERMKLHDKDSFEFYKQVGATIVPHAALSFIHSNKDGTGKDRDTKFTPEEIEKMREEINLPTWFNLKRPSFGCLAYGIYPEAEMRELRERHKKWSLWIPKFMYFVKYRRPPSEVQPIHGEGDVYKMTVWWDQPLNTKEKRAGGAPTEYAVFCSKDGKHIDVLKVIDTEFVSIRHTHGHARGKMFSIPHRAWHIPGAFEEWAKQYGLTPQVHLAHMFCNAVKRMENSHYSMVRVAIHKGDLTAVFGVNISRMSYFFQDRDLTFTVNGARKKVFHIVRAHERHYQTGKVVPIKIHFRGEKEFDWAGYKVKITIPGLDHFMLSEVDIGVDGELEKGQKYITEGEFGKILVDRMNKGGGGMER